MPRVEGLPDDLVAGLCDPSAYPDDPNTVDGVSDSSDPHLSRVPDGVTRLQATQSRESRLP